MTIHPISETEPVPLHIYHHPYCLSFAFFEVKDERLNAGDEKDDAPTQTATILVDPSFEEEACCGGNNSLPAEIRIRNKSLGAVFKISKACHPQLQKSRVDVVV